MGEPCAEAEPLVVDDDERGSPARAGPSGEDGSDAGVDRGVSDAASPDLVLRFGDEGSVNGFGGSYGGVTFILGIGEVCPRGRSGLEPSYGFEKGFSDALVDVLPRATCSLISYARNAFGL